MDISIIICTYNRSESLTNTLNSIVNLYIPENLTWEILAIDNNSSDAAAAVIDDFVKKARIPIKHMFEAIKNKSHVLNKGAREANGEILVFIDDDMLLDKYYIKGVTEAVRKYPDVNVFGGRVLIEWSFPKPDWVITEGHYKNIDGILGTRDYGDNDKDFDGVPTIGNTFLSKKIFTSNFLREDLGPRDGKARYGEDSEFFSRLKTKGEKILYIPAAVTYHNIEKYKIDKKYFCQRRFDCAYSAVGFEKAKADVSRLFGIPRYLLGYLALNFIKYLFSLTLPRRFYYKLKLSSVLGQIAGHIAGRGLQATERRKPNDENKRNNLHIYI